MRGEGKKDMMRNIVLGVAALALAGVARADEPVKPKLFRASLGTYSAKDGGSRSSLNFGYDLPPMKGQKPTNLLYSAYLDTNSGKKGGVTHSLTGIGLAVRSEGAMKKADGSLYKGAGVGLYTIKAGTSRSRLGGKLFVGYERKEGVFAEASYNLIPKVSGYDASGIGLDIGYRF
jgi:hypothetical protein